MMSMQLAFLVVWDLQPGTPTSGVDVPSAASSGGVHYRGRTAGAGARSGYVSSPTAAGGMLYRMEPGLRNEAGAWEGMAYDGGRLRVFPDDPGLVLGLCCVFSDGAAVSVDIAGRGANVASTATADRKDLGYWKLAE